MVAPRTAVSRCGAGNGVPPLVPKVDTADDGLRAQKTVTSIGEEVEYVKHVGLRAQKTPPPGARPGILAEPGPQRSDRTVRRPAGTGGGVGRGSGQLRASLPRQARAQGAGGVGGGGQAKRPQALGQGGRGRRGGRGNFLALRHFLALLDKVGDVLVLFSDKFQQSKV